MDWSGLLDPTVLPPIAVAVAGLAMAAILVVLDLANRANRVFATYLFLISLVRLLRGLAPLATPAEAAYLANVGVYVAIAVSFTALYFLLIYPRPRHGPLPAWLVLTLCVAAALGLWIQFASDHGTFSRGPLPLSVFGLPMNLSVNALICLALTRDALSEPGGESRSSLLLLAMAFAVPVANTFMSRLLNLPGDLYGGGRLAVFTDVVAILAGLVVLAAAILAWRVLAGQGPQRNLAWLFLLVIAVPPAYFLLFQGLAPVAPQGVVALAAGILSSLTGLLQLVLIGFGLVRRRLFEIDLRRRVAARAGLVAAILLAFFLVVTQLVEGLAQQQMGRYGVLIGALAAGLLLFALTPLQRLADRLARLGLPTAPPVKDMAPTEREEMYRDLARAAWIDGAISRKERQMLDVARQKLSVSAEAASRIESEASRA